MKKLIVPLAAFAVFLPSIGLISVALFLGPAVRADCPPQISGTGRIVFPLPTGTWVTTDNFGWRTDPATGVPRLHTGTDYGAAAGTPILAVADGVVTHAGPFGTYGGLIIIEHILGGQLTASAYAHMWDTGIHVTEGQHVTAGQQIGDVGSAGYSTGPHLHLEIRPEGSHSPAVDAAVWLTEHQSERVASAATTARCTAGPVAVR